MYSKDQASKLNVGLVGPSGVGKGFFVRAVTEQIKAGKIYKFTNRPPRKTDYADGVIALPEDIFTTMESKLTGIHRPFEDHRIYGWDFSSGNESLNFFDPNLEVVGEIRANLNGDGLFLIGIISPREYRSNNLTEGCNDKVNIPDVQTRLNVGDEYCEYIVDSYRRGMIDSLVELNESERGNAVNLIARCIPIE